MQSRTLETRGDGGDDGRRVSRITGRVLPLMDPRKVPPYTLWTMRKNDRTREARTRLLPIGDRLLELAVYERRTGGSLELVWAQTVRGGNLYTIAQEMQRAYEGEGWRLVAELLSDSELPD